MVLWGLKSNGTIMQSFNEYSDNDNLDIVFFDTCPYVQDILYTVFVEEMQQAHNQNILPLEPTDFLEDVFNPPIFMGISHNNLTPIL
ncbi:hypothetical protein MHK_007360 [Candidatus Magnetomorum sp. HK-1]|nr:hypothetical protein MHK_007360 [Candidatus Magnetomorum sp. HK-1]